jgi:type IV pilus assembly protein PilP
MSAVGGTGVVPDVTQEFQGPAPPPDAKPEDIVRFQGLQRWHDELLATYNIDVNKTNDPFMPIETVARPPETDPNVASQRRNLPMLQRLALNQFTLEAIVVSNDSSKSTALVNSGGTGFLIHKGTKIGPNNGFVRDITPTKVIIEESEVNYRGERSTRITEFSLNTLDAEVTDFIG